MAELNRIPFVGMFDIARPTRAGFPSNRANYEMIEKLFSNFGFYPVDELTVREFWITNLIARLTFGSSLRIWRKNFLRLSLIHRALLRRKTRCTSRLVLGWEMSPSMKTWLDERDVAYLDVRVAPIRFYTDLLFNFLTNNKNVYDEITRRFSAVSEAEIRVHAAQCKADESERDVLVLIGQVPNDASLIDDRGRFVSLSDYRSDIAELGSRFRLVLYRPHPKARPGPDPLPETFAPDPKSSVYTHMIRGASFCAVSSSVLHEAALFGCPTYRLRQSDPTAVACDRHRHDNVHLFRSLQRIGAAPTGAGDVALMRLMFGQNASDLTPVRNSPVPPAA